MVVPMRLDLVAQARGLDDVDGALDKVVRLIGRPLSATWHDLYLDKRQVPLLSESTRNAAARRRLAASKIHKGEGIPTLV